MTDISDMFEIRCIIAELGLFCHLGRRFVAHFNFLRAEIRVDIRREDRDVRPRSRTAMPVSAKVRLILPKVFI